ncbi:MAG: beta-propeller fold lactonase family protein [Planctomycetes bacterium]|nr:beta-propeller fold lactonase family protein [Planctomycetota bacterium]
MRTFLLRFVGVLSASTLATAFAQNGFVNWENPHVHPLELAPGGAQLLAVNTADDRLEVFDLASGKPVRAFDVPVGIDPVSVRARNATEAWVVNHVSDSVSIVDLATRRVLATLRTDDEPADVVFAGTPLRAYVSCSQANTLLVFDPANLAAAPTRIAIDGEDPRALAVSPDGSKVYLAIFESGNSSTVLGEGAVMNLGFPPNVVNLPAGPYGGQNPPPNSSNPGGFDPPQNGANPAPPRVGLIVKKSAAGQWRDDFTGDWTSLVSGANAAQSGRPVGWDLVDKDVAIVDTATNGVTYARRLMNIGMALAVNPANGEITLVGTDATNEVRFEPVLRGKFLKVELARVSPAGATLGIVDLNPHLTYATGQVPQVDRDQSLGDPRGIVWNAAGTRGYVTGMGSNNLVVIDALGARAGIAPTVAVGEGPTGVVLDEARGQAYVLCKFEGAISVVGLASELETARVRYFDPTPVAIELGRKHLYDTRKNSGLGQIACGSCHVDARLDALAWDLGDPTGAMRAVTGNNLAANIPGLNTGFQPFHPMKGPMTTQTLQDIIGKEPLHWRGDKSGLEEFNGAFLNLQGDDANLTPAEMQQFEDFLATITFPPNPFRNFDNSLPTSLPLPGHFTTGRFGPAGLPLPNGNAVTALSRYRTGRLDGGAVDCVTCHTLPTGAGTDYTLVGATYQLIPPGPNGERHLALVSQDGSSNVSMKIPQLRNLYEKVGFETTQLSNRRGFGMLHDGSVDSIARFVTEPVFNLVSDQDTANMVAFMLAFSGSELPQGSTTTLTEPPGPSSKDTHAAVGWQLTLAGAPTPAQTTLLNQMLAQANLNKVGLVVKGVQGGLTRGWQYVGSNNYQSDRAAQTNTHASLLAAAAVGSELTWTVVPKGTERRRGIDRDVDNVLDRDEADLGADPADPLSFPGSSGTPFCFGDGNGTECPCGNTSLPGTNAGCLNSLGQGASLAATGAASLANDTIALNGAQMPNSTAFYLQGTQRENAGCGTVLYDGLLCVGGSLIRLGSRTNIGGASSFPGGVGASVSVRGGVVAPGTRQYQVWYRNAASFCTPGTANLSNGWELTWAP